MASFSECWGQLKAKGYKHANGKEVLTDNDKQSILDRTEMYKKEDGLSHDDAIRKSLQDHHDEAHAQVQSIHEQVFGKQEPVAPKEPWRQFEEGGTYQVSRQRLHPVLDEQGQPTGNYEPYTYNTEVKIVKETPKFVITDHGKFAKHTLLESKRTDISIPEPTVSDVAPLSTESVAAAPQAEVAAPQDLGGSGATPVTTAVGTGEALRAERTGIVTRAASYQRGKPNTLDNLTGKNKARIAEIDAQLAQEPPSVPETPVSTTAKTSQEIPVEPPTPPVTETAPISDDQHVSTIANRFTEERTKSGELGEIAPGQGYSTRELADAGLKMTPEQINQHVSDLMNGTGDPIEQGKAVRAEEARLSQRSNELSRAASADPTNTEARLMADNAFKDLTDFHNNPVARIKEIFHGLGMSMQGELPVDLSTFNGLREAFLRDTGKLPSPEVEPQLQAMAEKVTKSVAEDNGAKQNLGQAIDKATARRKLPTYDEVRQNIADRMKIEPCRT